MLATLGGFPSEEPTAYTLIEKYTASGTFTAPESGYFQVELFGASGTGGKAYAVSSRKLYGGGGAGGGGYACSRIKLKKGDIVKYTLGTAGNTSSVIFSSSLETYANIQITSGTNGGAATSSAVGAGGAGGNATGGNFSNVNGGKGDNGSSNVITNPYINAKQALGGDGGGSGNTAGNAGGRGGSAFYWPDDNTMKGENGNPGKKAFIKIYRGNTN